MQTKHTNSVAFLINTKSLWNSKLLCSKIVMSSLAFASAFLEMALKFQWLVFKCLCADISNLFNYEALQ